MLVYDEENISDYISVSIQYLFLVEINIVVVNFHMFLLQKQPTNRVDKILDYATLQITLKVYPINKGQDFHGFKQRRRKS